MLAPEINELITSTGPGTPCGEVMRRYWQPAALSDELNGPRPVRPVTLLGERLVLFRDETGTPGLMHRHCPHRGADLCYGRLEDGGLRCPFHGWLFDTSGKCVEMPGEPEGSTTHERIGNEAYPCVERNGIVFAYMGPGEPPALPDYDCFAAPESHAFAFKGLIECNWLQALEVGIDPVHASFLHRFLQDEDTADAYGKQFRDTSGNTDIPVTQILREYPRPDINVEQTGYGLRITSLRELPGDAMHVRVTNEIFPNAIVIPMSNDMTLTQWHVPVDDVTCYWYAIFAAFHQPVDHQKMREQRLKLYELPDYVPRKNKSNDYGYDPREQQSETYTGMGLDINVHDQWAVESPGPLQDRSREHLVTSDKAIIANRRMLRSAIEAAGNGSAQPANGTDRPIAIDTLVGQEGWQQAWQDNDRARRQGSPWAGERKAAPS